VGMASPTVCRGAADCLLLHAFVAFSREWKAIPSVGEDCLRIRKREDFAPAERWGLAPSLDRLISAHIPVPGRATGAIGNPGSRFSGQHPCFQRNGPKPEATLDWTLAIHGRRQRRSH
jgi:hypothetical protein